MEALGRIRSMADAFNGGAMDSLSELIGQGAVLDRGNGGKLAGREALAGFFRQLRGAVPDAVLVERDCRIFGGDAACAEWWLRGTQNGLPDFKASDLSGPGANGAVEIALAALIYFEENGLISRIALRGDLGGLLHAPEISPGFDLSPEVIRAMAEDYTRAWSSGDAASVGAYYALDGWISINGGCPSAGRAAVTEMAAGFMGAFPDMQLFMDDIQIAGNRVVYAWTLKGTNTGPGGTGKRVAFSGMEVWRLNSDCRVAQSHGYFDTAAYSYQLEHGSEAIDGNDG